MIINADDFGLSDAVNQAVAEAHKNGVLTSTTIMANMPAADSAVEIARRLPNLGLGVHLNLFKAGPLAKHRDVDCLCNANHEFAFGPARLSLLSIVGHRIRRAIRTELAAQIQWVIDKGLRPTHLDSHKHIHSFPAIYPIVCGLAKQFGIAAIRWPFEPESLSTMPWPLSGKNERKSAKRLRTVAKINRLQNPSFIKTDAFFGISHLGKIDVTFLRAVTLYNSAATAEIMTHPGLRDDNRQHNGNSLKQRIVELQALCDERTKRYFKDAGIKLVHFGQL